MNTINPKRPKNLIVFFENKGRLEMAILKRRWYKWMLYQFQTYEENNPEIRGIERKKTAVLWLLTRDKYQMHQVSYPKGVGEDLLKVIHYDLEEIFPTGEETFFILGEAFEAEDRFILPVFYQTKLQYQTLIKGFEGFLQISAVPLAFFYPYLIQKSTCVILFPLNGNSYEASIYINGVLRDVFIVERENIAYFKSYLEILNIKEVFFLGNSTNDLLKEFKIKKINLKEKVLENFLPYLINKTEIYGWPQGVRLKMDKFILAYVSIVIIIIFYLLYPVFLHLEKKHLNQKLTIISQEVKQLQRKWEPIEKVEKEIETLKSLYNKLDALKGKVVSPLEVLKILTEITPNDTWISYFKLKEKELIIRGESASVVSYMEMLTQVPAFEEVKLVSPVRKNPRSHQERFHIRIKLK
ncbi:MAG: PilN domain-containing protein [Candidatus Desulfofervidus auxilii]|nr:PilN domain-containing protein [Candidatus Desulfofervidus auxilii]